MSGSCAAAAILAGGQSARMGADKARLRVEGEPLLERTARVAAEAGLAVLVVGRERPADWSGAAAVRFVPDEEPGRGPLGGLQAALRAAGGPVLALPCDLPRLTSAAVAWLRDEWLARAPALGLVVRGPAGLPEPLFAVYGPACLPLIEERLRTGRLSLHGLLESAAFDTAEAPPWLPPALHNANTPADL